MDDAYSEQAFFQAGFEICFQHATGFGGCKSVQIQFAGDRDADRFFGGHGEPVLSFQRGSSCSPVVVSPPGS